MRVTVLTVGPGPLLMPGRIRREVWRLRSIRPGLAAWIRYDSPEGSLLVTVVPSLHIIYYNLTYIKRGNKLCVIYVDVSVVTGVVVEIIVVIIAADAYATIPVKIIVITIGIATATAAITTIAVSIHVPEKEKKLMRPDLEMAVIMPPVGRIIVVANDICKKGGPFGPP